MNVHPGNFEHTVSALMLGSDLFPTGDDTDGGEGVVMRPGHVFTIVMAADSTGRTGHGGG